MKNIVFKVTLVATLLFAVMPYSYSQTVHAIIACNTIDSSIGVGMTSDMKNMRNAIQLIISMLDCEYDEKVFDGNSCTKANITNYINQMDIASGDDIVIFFYGGHGTHAFNNASDPWPQMCMNTNIESLFMPVASVEKLIAAKNPKLMIILTNCCNKEQSGVTIKPLYAQSAGPTIQSDYNAEAFRKLFLGSKGKVMMTSSKLGQYSWCGGYGGLFTNYLLEVLDGVGMNRIPADWKSVCKETHDKTLACRNLPGGAVQEPYYEVSAGGNSNPVPPVPPVPSTDGLFKALQILLNKDFTVAQRLGHIASIKDKFFTADAHVVTVGRNGTSKIMYEDVSDFLRRLALSNKIKQINVLEGNNQGKNSIITVHEVRY